MSSLLTTIREFLGPPDPRSEREIEDDINAEFTFHIEQIEAELIEQGVPREHAADLARARFGNQHKLKQRCKRIALEERIMLQKINTVLMIIVMLAVIGVSIQMYLTQQYNSLALQDITTQISKIQVVAQTPPDAAPETIDTHKGVAHVLVEGDIERPGYYPVQLGETLRRDVLVEVGVDRNMGVQYFQRGSTRAAPIDAENYLEGAAGRRLVGDGDRIFVVASPITDRQRNDTPGEQPELPPGTWVQVDETGRPLREPLTAELFDRDDVRSLTGVPTVHVTLHDHERSLTIPLQSDGTTRISVQADHIRRGTPRSSRWRIRDDDILEINITPAVREFDEPLLLRHVDSLDGSNASKAVQADARILIEGDIERPGWYPISLDEATYVHDLLRRAGVRERQWVLHRPGGESGQYELADLYLGDDPPRVVIRPGDEIQVADRRGQRTRGRFFLANAERYLFPYQWRQADENGELVEDGWRVDLSGWHILGYGRNRVAHGSLIHPNGQDVYNVRIAETSGIIEFSDERPEQISVSVTMDVESIHLETQEWRAPPRTPRDEIEQMRDQFETLFAEIGFPDKITFVRIAPE